MKLTVKTLKGSKFEVDCEPDNTLLEVKGIIVSSIRFDCVQLYCIVLYSIRLFDSIRFLSI